MKITFRILFQEDAIAALARDPVVLREGDLVAIAFDRVLQLTRECSGGWFNPLVSFTSKELDGASCLQLDCRKTVRETDEEWEIASGSGEITNSSASQLIGDIYQCAPVLAGESYDLGGWFYILS